MKAKLNPPVVLTPPLPTVTLELSQDEARKLRAFFGGLGSNVYKQIHANFVTKNGVKYAQNAFPTPENVQNFGGGIYATLEEVVPQPRWDDHGRGY